MGGVRDRGDERQKREMYRNQRHNDVLMHDTIGFTVFFASAYNEEGEEMNDLKSHLADEPSRM